MNVRFCLFGFLPLAWLGACGRVEAPPQAPRPAIVMTVGQAAQGVPKVFPGEVRSRYELDLAFRIGGKILSREVKLGDPVRKGQVLARLDPADVALAGQSAAAQLAAAEAELALARSEYERAQALVAQKFLSASVLDARRSQFEAATAKVAQARAGRDSARNQLSYATLVADRDGVVTALPVEAGQVVAAGQLVVRLADPAAREVLVWIPESRVQALRLGQAAIVRSDAAPGRTYRGSLRELAASADPATRTYAARVAVADPDPALGLGSSAGAGFFAEDAAKDVELPLAAVLRDPSGQARVWVVDRDNRVQSRAVAVASWQDRSARIGSGLAAGERVVTVGAHALGAGEQVNPVERQAPVMLDIAR